MTSRYGAGPNKGVSTAVTSRFSANLATSAAVSFVVPIGVRVLQVVIHSVRKNVYEIFPCFSLYAFSSPIRGGGIVDPCASEHPAGRIRQGETRESASVGFSGLRAVIVPVSVFPTRATNPWRFVPRLVWAFMNRPCLQWFALGIKDAATVPATMGPAAAPDFSWTKVSRSADRTTRFSRGHRHFPLSQSTRVTESNFGRVH